MGLQVYGLLLSLRPPVRIRAGTPFQENARVLFPWERRSSHFSFGIHRQNDRSLRFECTGSIRKRHIAEMPFRWALFLKIAINAEFCPYKKALSLIFALQIRESAFVLLTMRFRSQRDTVNSQSRKGSYGSLHFFSTTHS